jgi:hypothetical protein
VGGLQGVFQNLGSSLGTALIGSILIGALTTSFAGGVAASTLPDSVKSTISEKTQGGVAIVPVATVTQIGADNGLTSDQSEELADIYRDSQLSSLGTAFFGLIAITLGSLLLSSGIPNEVAGRKRDEKVAL